MADSSSVRRTSVFIDGGYLFKVFEPYGRRGYRYSGQRLITKIGANGPVQKVHYINSINLRNPATKEKQEKFYYGYLRDRLGWDVTILPLQWPGGRAEQKGTDSTLSLLLHERAIANEYDTAILLAADSDFCPPVELVKKLGKIVSNAYFSVRPSFHLQQACNGKPIRLDDLDFVYRDGEPKNLFCIKDIDNS